MASLFHRHGCKAVIFDMDGVLIDSEPIHFQVLNKICAPLGFTLTWEEFVPLIGKDEMTFWSQIVQERRLPLPPQEYIQRYVLGVESFFAQAQHLPPIDGVTELLDALKKEGISIGLASSSACKIVEDTLRALGISSYFDAFVGADRVGRGKPDPLVYLCAMEDLGVSPSQCGAIEDSHFGMLAAKASGAKLCVGYRSPSAPGQDISMAHLLVDSLRELL